MAPEGLSGNLRPPLTNKNHHCYCVPGRIPSHANPRSNRAEPEIHTSHITPRPLGCFVVHVSMYKTPAVARIQLTDASGRGPCFFNTRHTRYRPTAATRLSAGTLVAQRQPTKYDGHPYAIPTRVSSSSATPWKPKRCHDDTSNASEITNARIDRAEVCTLNNLHIGTFCQGQSSSIAL